MDHNRNFWNFYSVEVASFRRIFTSILLAFKGFENTLGAPFLGIVSLTLFRILRQFRVVERSWFPLPWISHDAWTWLGSPSSFYRMSALSQLVLCTRFRFVLQFNFCSFWAHRFYAPLLPSNLSHFLFVQLHYFLVDQETREFRSLCAWLDYRVLWCAHVEVTCFWEAQLWFCRCWGCSVCQTVCCFCHCLFHFFLSLASFLDYGGSFAKVTSYTCFLICPFNVWGVHEICDEIIEYIVLHISL